MNVLTDKLKGMDISDSSVVIPDELRPDIQSISVHVISGDLPNPSLLVNRTIAFSDVPNWKRVIRLFNKHGERWIREAIVEKAREICLDDVLIEHNHVAMFVDFYQNALITCVEDANGESMF